MIRRAVTRLARQRALHFLVGGALLLAGVRLCAPPPPLPPVLDSSSDDALLLREALALRLDDSRTVRGRLVELAASLALAAPGDRAGLEREARALGLERSDPVLQRHMVELVRLAAGAPRQPPDEATLRAYYAAHAARFATPERLRLTQIYLSPARRGAQASADAAALLARLDAGTLTAEAAVALGDGLGSVAPQIGPLSRDELGRRLGASFADAAFALPPGEWRGPIASSYGLHLVRVDAHLPAARPDLARVRGRVLHAYLRERGAAQLRGALAALRAP
ncbi:MAG: peptidylprolyl isomerase [Deltaproteobacteria bacterium]|nr:peptidylprolyl isomerase [Deltaproteobacteria bacterium]